MSERKHLTQMEVDKLIAATRGRRHEVPDRCLLLPMFRHGLRVSEACSLQLSQVDVESRVRIRNLRSPASPQLSCKKAAPRHSL